MKIELTANDSSSANSIVQQLQEWLGNLPQQDGHYLISTPRRFAHAEADYDALDGNKPPTREVGEGLVNICRAHGGDFGSPAIEVGCGTGRASTGLALENAYPFLLLTDPSPEFLNITRKKLSEAGAPLGRVEFGVLTAEDLHLLPGGMFSLIAMRSVLHHVMDIPAYAAQAARILRPGGLMVMEEPCLEGAVLMAALAQLLPVATRHAGDIWSDDCQHKLQLFLDTMKFYCRNDVDKSQAEDKHIFRVDQLNAIGIDAGFDVHFIPNQTFYNWTTRARQHPARELFSDFMGLYLELSMGFDETFMEHFDRHLRPLCSWIDELCQQGNGPYCHGIFIWKKR